VPKADIGRFFSGNIFFAKIGKRKEGRYYIDKEWDCSRLGVTYKPSTSSNITSSWHTGAQKTGIDENSKNNDSIVVVYFVLCPQS
jgi:hypothetical protein